jgi:hypothetical protein
MLLEPIIITNLTYRARAVKTYITTSSLGTYIMGLGNKIHFIMYVVVDAAVLGLAPEPS